MDSHINMINHSNDMLIDEEVYFDNNSSCLSVEYRDKHEKNKDKKKKLGILQLQAKNGAVDIEDHILLARPEVQQPRNI